MNNSAADRRLPLGPFETTVVSGGRRPLEAVAKPAARAVAALGACPPRRERRSPLFRKAAVTDRRYNRSSETASLGV